MYNYVNLCKLMYNNAIQYPCITMYSMYNYVFNV